MKPADVQKLAESSFISIGRHIKTEAKSYTEPGKADRLSQIHHVLVGVGVVKVVRYLNKPDEAKVFQAFETVLVTLEPERMARQRGPDGKTLPQGYALKLTCEALPV